MITNSALYFHAYIVYNISMKVKPIDRIQELLKQRNGILLTAELAKHDIPRTYLSILESQGVIERITRGVYLAPDAMADEMLSLQARYKNAIYSHETALYLLDLSDRTPLAYAVTVPSSYNATSLKSSGAKVYFIKHNLISLGKMTAKSTHGNDIRCYNLERTICDVLRSRNQMDVGLVNEALKRYVRKKEMNLDRLYHYAGQFHIQKIIRATIEVLL